MAAGPNSSSGSPMDWRNDTPPQFIAPPAQSVQDPSHHELDQTLPNPANAFQDVVAPRFGPIVRSYTHGRRPVSLRDSLLLRPRPGIPSSYFSQANASAVPHLAANRRLYSQAFPSAAHAVERPRARNLHWSSQNVQTEGNRFAHPTSIHTINGRDINTIGQNGTHHTLGQHHNHPPHMHLAHSSGLHRAALTASRRLGNQTQVSIRELRRSVPSNSLFQQTPGRPAPHMHRSGRFIRRTSPPRASLPQTPMQQILLRSPRSVVLRGVPGSWPQSSLPLSDMKELLTMTQRIHWAIDKHTPSTPVRLQIPGAYPPSPESPLANRAAAVGQREQHAPVAEDVSMKEFTVTARPQHQRTVAEDVSMSEPSIVPHTEQQAIVTEDAMMIEDVSMSEPSVVPHTEQQATVTEDAMMIEAIFMGLTQQQATIVPDDAMITEPTTTQQIEQQALLANDIPMIEPAVTSQTEQHALATGDAAIAEPVAMTQAQAVREADEVDAYEFDNESNDTDSVSSISSSEATTEDMNEDELVPYDDSSTSSDEVLHIEVDEKMAEASPELPVEIEKEPIAMHEHHLARLNVDYMRKCQQQFDAVQSYSKQKLNGKPKLSLVDLLGTDKSRGQRSDATKSIVSTPARSAPVRRSPLVSISPNTPVIPSPQHTQKPPTRHRPGVVRSGPRSAFASPKPTASLTQRLANLFRFHPFLPWRRSAPSATDPRTPAKQTKKHVGFYESPKTGRPVTGVKRFVMGESISHPSPASSRDDSTLSIVSPSRSPSQDVTPIPEQQPSPDAQLGLSYPNASREEPEIDNANSHHVGSSFEGTSSQHGPHLESNDSVMESEQADDQQESSTDVTGNATPTAEPENSEILEQATAEAESAPAVEFDNENDPSSMNVTANDLGDFQAPSDSQDRLNLESQDSAILEPAIDDSQESSMEHINVENDVGQVNGQNSTPSINATANDLDNSQAPSDSQDRLNLESQDSAILEPAVDDSQMSIIEDVNPEDVGHFNAENDMSAISDLNPEELAALSNDPSFSSINVNDPAGIPADFDQSAISSINPDELGPTLTDEELDFYHVQNNNDQTDPSQLGPTNGSDSSDESSHENANIRLRRPTQEGPDDVFVDAAKNDTTNDDSHVPEPPRTPSPKLSATFAGLNVSGRRHSDRHQLMQVELERRRIVEAEALERRRIEAQVAAAIERGRIEREEAELRAQQEREAEEEMRRLGIRRMPRERMIQPLSAGADQRVTDALRRGMTAQVALTSTGNPISRRDIGKVLPQAGTGDDPSGWLNDEIIAAYLQAVVDYGHKNLNVRRNDTPKVHAFNTFFYENLKKEGGYENVKRWARRAKIGGRDLEQVEHVFIPINLGGNHWTLAVVSPTRRTMEFFDSLHHPSGAIYANIKAWLAGELGSAYREEEWTIREQAGFEGQGGGPTQNNARDCGVFTVTTAKMIVLGVDPMAVSANDMPLQRRRVVAELLNGGFSGEFEPNVAFV